MLWTPWHAFTSMCGACRQNVQSCDLVGLADLDSAASKVRATLAAFIRRLAALGVGGVRIDAAKHMPAADVAHILEQADSPGLLVFQVRDWLA